MNNTASNDFGAKFASTNYNSSTRSYEAATKVVVKQNQIHLNEQITVSSTPSSSELEELVELSPEDESKFYKSVRKNSRV
jgi:hypothetical protein